MPWRLSSLGAPARRPTERPDIFDAQGSSALQHRPHALARLVQQVQLRHLHMGSAFSDPAQWFLDWLSRPADYLSGQRPADFLRDDDWELIILSLLMQHRPGGSA